MRAETKVNKENFIIEAAEKVFAQYGFKNARMEEVAKEAGITKVTLYSYFKSKENLYMAVTFKALEKLVVKCKECISNTADQKGIESVLSIMEGFINFCEENHLYSEVLLDYFSLIRSSDESKLTLAIKESGYFEKLQGIQNEPFKLTARQIQRGIDDKSISPTVDPNISTLYGWATAVGLVKISTATESNQNPIFKVKINDLKKAAMDIQRKAMAFN